MPIYAPGVKVDTTFVSAVKQDVINGVETALLAAGWSTVSGHATTNLLMQSAATTQALAIRARFRDNGGTCVQVSLESTDGTLTFTQGTNNGGNLIPGFTYRVIASSVQAFIYVPSNYGSSRMFVVISCPFRPAPLSVPAYLGFMTSDSTNDGSGSQMESWRIRLGSNSGSPNCQAFDGANKYENSNSTNQQDYRQPNLWIPQMANASGVNIVAATAGSQWANGDIVTGECLVGWALNGAVPNQIRGQLWDALAVYKAYNGDTTFNFDGHNWRCITNLNNGGSNIPIGSLFVATS